jgi:hypothetical protein
VAYLATPQLFKHVHRLVTDIFPPFYIFSARTLPASSVKNISRSTQQKRLWRGNLGSEIKRQRLALFGFVRIRGSGG